MKNTPGSGIWHKRSPGSLKGLWPFQAQLGPSYSFSLYPVAWIRKTKKDHQTWKLWSRYTWRVGVQFRQKLSSKLRGWKLPWRESGWSIYTHLRSKKDELNACDRNLIAALTTTNTKSAMRMLYRSSNRIHFWSKSPINPTTHAVICNLEQP